MNPKVWRIPKQAISPVIRSKNTVSEGSSEELGSGDISSDFTENLSESENDSLIVGPNEVDLVSNDEGGVPQQDLTMGQEQLKAFQVIKRLHLQLIILL